MLATSSDLPDRCELMLGGANAAGGALSLSTLDAIGACQRELAAAVLRIAAAATEACVEADGRGDECPLPTSFLRAIKRAIRQVRTALDRLSDATTVALRRGHLTRRSFRSLCTVLDAQARCLSDVFAAFHRAFGGEPPTA
jgi:hypothetical protein